MNHAFEDGERPTLAGFLVRRFVDRAMLWLLY